MIRVPLTKGKYTILNDQDAHLVEGRWLYHNSGYAARYKWWGDLGYKFEYLHHYVIGKPKKGLVVDHINGDPLDNRRENLRIISQRENCHNNHGKIKKSSKYIGVRFNKPNGKWVASISIKHKPKYLGIFDSEDKAHEAYLKELERMGK